MRRAAHNQKPRNAANGTGENHRADNDAFDVDTDIFCGVLALAHHRDFIPVLAVLQIYIQDPRQYCHHNDVQQILHAKQVRDAGAKQFRTHGIGTGLVRNFQKILNQLHGNIVHHQSEQGLVGVPVCLEKCRDEAPCGAGNHCRRQHQKHQHRRGHLIVKIQHHNCRGKTAHQGLPLGAGIPETHPERGGHGKRNAKQNRNIMNCYQQSSLSESALHHGFEHRQRVIPRAKDRNDRTDNQRRKNCDGADAD